MPLPVFRLPFWGLPCSCCHGTFESALELQILARENLSLPLSYCIELNGLQVHFSVTECYALRKGSQDAAVTVCERDSALNIVY